MEFKMDLNKLKKQPKMMLRGNTMIPKKPKITTQPSLFSTGPMEFMFGNEKENSPLFFNKNASSDAAQNQTKPSQLELSRQESQKNGNKQYGGSNAAASMKEDNFTNARGGGTSKNQKPKPKQAEKQPETPVHEGVPSLTVLKTEDLTEEDRLRYIQLLESSYAAGEMYHFISIHHPWKFIEHHPSCLWSLCCFFVK